MFYHKRIRGATLCVVLLQVVKLVQHERYILTCGSERMQHVAHPVEKKKKSG
jgi:hypothetical protein